MTQVELHGGPFDGDCHELQFGWPQPAKMALPDPDGIHQHWYTTTTDGHATFERTEKRA